MSLTRSVLAFSAALALCFSVQAMAVEGAPAPGAAITSSPSHVIQKININTATAEELDQLKGVGANKAQAIVEYRTQHGPFKTVDDLASVRGFGSKTLSTLLAKNPGSITTD